jgi:uncharacterized protein YjdB
VIQASSDGGDTEETEPVYLTAIALNQETAGMYVGDTVRLNVIYTPDNADYPFASFSSSDDGVVTISDDGNMTAVKVGTAVITATSWDGGFTAECAVTVHKREGGGEDPQSIAVKRIKLSGISHKIAAGRKIQLKATVTPKKATDKSLIWSVSDTTVASVTQKGLVTIMPGTGGKTVRIRAAARDGSETIASWTITSMKGKVTKIRISGKTKVKAGKSLKLKAKVKASSGANKKLKWKSSNTRYATVSSTGKVKTKKAGKGHTVKITAMATDGTGKKAVRRIRIK